MRWPQPQRWDNRTSPAAPNRRRCRMRLPQPQRWDNRTSSATPDCRRCRMRLPQPQRWDNRTSPAAPNSRRCRMRLPQPQRWEDRTSPAAPNRRRCQVRLPQPQRWEDRTSPATPNRRRCRVRLPPQRWDNRTSPASNCRRCRLRLPPPQRWEDRTSLAAPNCGRCRLRLPRVQWSEDRTSPRSAVLPQLSDEGGAARAGTVVGTARSPVVTYQNGQLTIDAETLTLAEVLKLVAEKTGAEIDVPSGSGLDRIIEHAGPGRAEDVLASLLNGSPFDFVIVSSPQPPHDPTQVLLFLHRKDTPATDQTVNASAQPTTPSSPALFKPPTTSVLFTPSANASSASVVAPPPLVMGAPAEPIPPEVREQMMRDFSRQLRGQPPQ